MTIHGTRVVRGLLNERREEVSITLPVLDGSPDVPVFRFQHLLECDYGIIHTDKTWEVEELVLVDRSVPLTVLLGIGDEVQNIHLQIHGQVVCDLTIIVLPVEFPGDLPGDGHLESLTHHRDRVLARIQDDFRCHLPERFIRFTVDVQWREHIADHPLHRIICG